MEKRNIIKSKDSNTVARPNRSERTHKAKIEGTRLPKLQVETTKNQCISASWKQRLTIKKKIIEAVSGWLESRIDNVFEMADEGSDRIRWDDINQLRRQIAGCTADDLHHDLGDWIETVIHDELRS